MPHDISPVFRVREHLLRLFLVTRGHPISQNFRHLEFVDLFATFAEIQNETKPKA
jgi:hypothetical protein